MGSTAQTCQAVSHRRKSTVQGVTWSTGVLHAGSAENNPCETARAAADVQACPGSACAQWKTRGLPDIGPAHSCQPSKRKQASRQAAGKRREGSRNTQAITPTTRRARFCQEVAQSTAPSRCSNFCKCGPRAAPTSGHPHILGRGQQDKTLQAKASSTRGNNNNTPVRACTLVCKARPACGQAMQGVVHTQPRCRKPRTTCHEPVTLISTRGNMNSTTPSMTHTAHTSAPDSQFLLAHNTGMSMHHVAVDCIRVSTCAQHVL